jgi:hypothetical protein
LGAHTPGLTNFYKDEVRVLQDGIHCMRGMEIAFDDLSPWLDAFQEYQSTGRGYYQASDKYSLGWIDRQFIELLLAALALGFSDTSVLP